MSVLALLVASVSLAGIGYLIGYRRGRRAGVLERRYLSELWGRSRSFDWLEGPRWYAGRKGKRT
jgi:hypothetical protein